MSEYVQPLIIGVVIILLNLLVRVYVEPKMPEKKKAISYIKNLFFFAIKYILPICLLIFMFIRLEFDKFFVFNVCFLFSSIFFNIIMDIFNKYRKLFSYALELIKEKLEFMDIEITDNKKEKT